MRAGLLVTLAICACSGRATTGHELDAATPVTWFQDVAPIVAAHCMTCHQPGGIAPFSLVDYADAAGYAADMLDQLHAGTMPPFYAGADPDCTPPLPYRDDPRLSAAELATLEQWVADGTPAGTPVTIAPPPPPALAGVTETLAPSVPFIASGDRDELICTILDPATTDGWLTGIQVRPGNAEVVHHAIVSELGPGSDLDALVASYGVGMPYDCAPTGLPGDYLYVWVPGNDPLDLAAGQVAAPLAAGAKLVVQIHYHPNGYVAAPDTTSFDLRTSRQRPAWLYFVASFGNATAPPALLWNPDDGSGAPQFRIPADNPAHHEYMHFIADLGGVGEARVYSANPHMHLIGTHISATATPPGGAPTCLADGAWNFDWQRTYVYDAPLDQLPVIHTGDAIDVTCEWNNTLFNPFELRLLADAGMSEPFDVFYGVGTTSEMCVENFGAVVPVPAALP